MQMVRLPFIGTTVATIAVLISATRAVTAPNCSCTAASPQVVLSNVTTGTTPFISDYPFASVYARQHDTAFVSFATSLVVLNTSTFVPTVSHTYVFSAAERFGALAGLTLTDNGLDILITTGSNHILTVNAADAAAGKNISLGYLNGTAAAGSTSSIEVVANQHYAFVSNEYGSAQTKSLGTVEAFAFDNSTWNSSLSGTPVGYIALGSAVVGLAFSPDKRVLYASSEERANSSTQCVIRSSTGIAEEDAREGTLSLLDVHKLEHQTNDSLITSVTAGCNVVRIVLSPDGQTVWLSARESNHIVAFSTEKLKVDPSNALVASVEVGTSPISLAFVRDGTRILTADSNRFDQANATSGISVVDVEAALQGKKAVLGRIPTGLFPRDIAVSPDGNTALVALYESGELQAIDVSTLP